MARPMVLHGTWDELAERAGLLRGRRNLTLIVPIDDEHAAENGVAPLHGASAEQKIRALDVIAQMSRELPGLPDEAFDREMLYEDTD
jgi:hypothetical protein